ncbi:PITRM1 [Cordylochernes scorpioides]|uniref:PITRM1 n=1 Tax=Cordylochernes scorpioides TaxID=51811 RepID=A0ABY6K131_9ARAC|nr:PITRM1 [Cordylochernes scorpioides]
MLQAGVRAVESKPEVVLVEDDPCNLLQLSQEEVCVKLLCQLFHLSHQKPSPAACTNHQSYVVGDNLHGYTIQQVENVPEFSLTAVRLRHDATGADHLHIDRQDSNNTFSVAFKTVPRDDTGVAHILEHLALCGSRNFPVRDPFFKMLTRSMATFMNDFTVRTTLKSTGLQEPLESLPGCSILPQAGPCGLQAGRLEHEKVEDPSSSLQLKGVVFNEMKGVFSDPSQVFGLALLNRIFPNQTYRHNFGGSSTVIPSLTYSQLRDFHSAYYHPSNSRFVTYGDLPLADHLQAINSYVLSNFSKSPPVPAVEDQPRQAITCLPMSPHPDRQTTVGVSYMLCRLTDLQESFNLALLCSLLLDGPNSPFHKALLDSGLGLDYCPDSGYNSYTRQSTFTVGLQGIHPDSVSKVKSLIEETFDSVIQEGLPAERVEALLHSLELATKHQTTNFGLKIATSVNGIWNHGANPIDALPINRYLDSFRKSYAEDPQFPQDLVRRNFKENPHKLTLVMAPSPTYEEEIKQAESRVLENKMAALQPEDKKRIYKEGLELQEKQKMKEDVSCLPSLRVSDVSPQLTNACSLDHTTLLGGAPLQLCQQPTNCVSYLRMVADVSQLPDNLKSWLPLFSSVLPKMGARAWDFRELDQMAERRTSGLSSSLHLEESSSQSFSQGIVLSSYCLDPNLDTMVDIWTQVLNSPRFQDADRLHQLVKMAASDLAQSITYHGHHYAVKLAASTLSPYAAARESYAGLAQVLQMKELAEKFDADLFLAQLKEIAGIIFHKNNLRFALNGSHSSLEHGQHLLENLLTSLPSISTRCSVGNQASRWLG